MAVTLSEVSDADLVTACRDENKDVALSELVRRHQIPVFRLLVGMLPTPDHAEAACAKIFVEASHRLEELEQPDGFRSWVVDLAREYVRRDGAAEGTIELEPPVFQPAKPPEDLMAEAVQSALGSLLPDERLALVMADVENEPVSSMASVLGIAEAAVEQSVARARDNFLTAMQAGAPTLHSEAASESGDDAAAEMGAELASLPVGAVVDKRYCVRALLGSGGMGAVYRAEHVTLHRDVALKTLHGRLGDNETLRKRFVREAEVLGKLEHEHFVSVSDFGETDKGLLYLVMELLDGKSLGDLMEQQWIAPRRAFDITRQVLIGLAHAHERGIVHRDVKPENIVLLRSESGGDFAKILDLGIATSASESASGQEGGVYGTPAYMSPEQVMGDELDGRSDLYAVSVMLFEMLTGQLPFDAPNTMAILAKHLSATPPTLEEVAPEHRYPEVVQELFDVGLKKKASMRFQSAEEFIQRLDGALPSLPGEEAVAATPAPRRSATTQPVERAKPRPKNVQPGALPSGVATQAGSRPARMLWAAIVAVVLAALLAWRLLAS